ncbi:hypothetical protein rsdtw13_04150 [Clostridium sp. TW13]|uniref:Uncharacterized protein n=1 Tax=Inconstantimicrobium mannanitabidum TaxID=1604901 RepID=A0ACB5R7J8_9CLOT|nr:hypothetical protein rsdtw13_04150 [Clostridium sp. TW13]
MIVDNIDDYLNKHRVKRINIGKSGANVYEVDNKYILNIY